MERRTYSLLLDEVKAELDLQNETIITDKEYVDYCNDTIQKAEGIIHDLHEDYFKTSARMQNTLYTPPSDITLIRAILSGAVDGVNDTFTITNFTPLSESSLEVYVDGLYVDNAQSLPKEWSLQNGNQIVFDPGSIPAPGQLVGAMGQLQIVPVPVNGYGLISLQSRYPLPSNIYANKLREIVFNDADLIYEVKPYSARKKQWKVAYMNMYYFDDNRVFWYQLVNDQTYDPANPLSTNVQIEFIPQPKISGDYVTLHYLREAAKVPYTNNTNTQIDIPEFYDYIKFEMMARCAFKSMNPKYEAVCAWAADAKTRMIQILSTRKEDGSTRIDPDFGFYEEHS